MNTIDLKKLGAVGDALHNLLDAAIEQQKIATQQQQTAQSAISEISSATMSVKDVVRTIKGQLTAEVQDALKDSSTQAAALLTKKFKEADNQAELAAAKYRSAVKWASWNVFCFVAGISLVITLGGTYILLRSIPSYDEIQALRNEKAQLSNTINVLEQRGGRATVGGCPTQGNSQRMCVRVIGSRGERYSAVIDGY